MPQTNDQTTFNTAQYRIKALSICIALRTKVNPKEETKMYEDYDYDQGTAYNSENFDDPEGIECMEPGNFDECMFGRKYKLCGCWKECKAGTL